MKKSSILIALLVIVAFVGGVIFTSLFMNNRGKSLDGYDSFLSDSVYYSMAGVGFPDSITLDELNDSLYFFDDDFDDYYDYYYDDEEEDGHEHYHDHGYNSMEQETHSVSSGVTDSNSAGAKHEAHREVRYTDMLVKYAKFDHIHDDLGQIIDSHRKVEKDAVRYIFEYDTGWKKTLSILKCRQCNGSGKCPIPHIGIGGCLFCKNTGICSLCQGNGENVFSYAGNTKTGYFYTLGGTLMRSDYISVPGIQTGSGNSGLGNSDAGHSLDRHESTCKHCHGSGRCSSCNGDRVVYNYSSHEYSTCPSCRGSGRCFNCYGTGKINLY